MTQAPSMKALWARQIYSAMIACDMDVYKCSFCLFAVLTRPCATFGNHLSWLHGILSILTVIRQAMAFSVVVMLRTAVHRRATYPSQTRVDAYGRPIDQTGINSQSYRVTRGQSNQYNGGSSIDSPVYASQEMMRGYSSQSTSTSGSVPSPQSSTAVPKE